MESFLSRVLPATGEYVVTAIQLGGRAWEVLCASQLDVAAAARRLSVKALNVFVAIGSYDKTRKAPLLKRALYLDLDSKDFGSKVQALRELNNFCRATGFPAPSIIVDSGNGYHAYWCFDADIEVSRWRALAARLKDKCTEVGFAADTTCTADAARILRVPTTLNHKQTPPKPCVVVQDTGQVFDPAALFRQLIPQADVFEVPTARLTTPTKAAAINADLAGGIEYEKPDADTVRSMLAKITIPDTGSERRQKWIVVLSALNSWDEGGEEGFAIAHEWSQTQPGYDNEAGVRKIYMSFGRGRVQNTIGTIIKMAKDAGWESPREPEPEQPAKTPTLEDVDVNNVTGVSDSWSTRVAAAVNQVRTAAVEAANALGKNRAPRSDIENILVSQFVYVKNQDTYYNLSNRDLYSKESIRDIFTPDMPRTKHGVPEDPCELLRRSPKKVIVDSLGFHPGQGALFSENGKDYVNKHTAPADPITPTTAEGRLISDFIDYLFPTPEDQAFKRYWLQFNAHLVQRPGIKIATALLFISETYGIGKSTAAYDIPRLLVGPANARLVSNELLEGRFTGYLGDAHFIHLQEVHVNGHWNSSKIANKLKAIVTDPTLSVEKKGQDDYNIPNRLIVTASSNYEDAILISSKQDRRWGIYELRPQRGWVAGGKEARQYFNRIHSFLQSPRAAGVLRYLFGHISLTGFDPQNPPPMTIAKERMADFSLSEEQAVIRAAYVNGDAPFHRDIFHMDEVRDLIKAETGKVYSSQRLGRWLKKAAPGTERIKQIRQGPGKMWLWGRDNLKHWDAALPDAIFKELAK